MPPSANRPLPDPLSRRERQIMDVVYRRGQATAAEIHADLSDAPSYSTVRTILKVLVRKGHLRHEHDGPRYVYFPVVPRDKLRRSALRRLLTTFFDNSVENAVAALMDLPSTKLTAEQLDRLSATIENARQGKKP